MEILIRNLQKKVPINPRQIQKLVQKILRHEGVKIFELSLAFVSHQKMRTMNRMYHSRDQATDVLTFDLGGFEGINAEVVISTDAAIQHARIYKTTLHQEIRLYIIHGILHLLGYDDHTKKDRERMRSKEQQLLRFLEQ